MKNKIIYSLILVILILICGCSNNTPEEAEKVAVQVSVAVNSMAFGDIYPHLTQQVQDYYFNQTNFFKCMEAWHLTSFCNMGNQCTVISYTYDKVVVIDDNTAYAYFTVKVGSLLSNQVTMTMYFENNAWKINAFNNFDNNATQIVHEYYEDKYVEYYAEVLKKHYD